MGNGKKSTIKEYRILESFVQCDFLDGFDYVDKAGSIVNIFARANKQVPNAQMEPSGMTIENPTEHIASLKVSPTRIWMHFNSPKNLGEVESNATKYLDRLLEIIGPTIYRRIGWRTHFIKPNLDSKNNTLLIARDKLGLDNYSLEEMAFTRKIDSVDVRISLSPTQNPENPNKGAVIYDVDIANKAETIDTRKSLKEFHSLLLTEVFPESQKGLL